MRKEVYRKYGLTFISELRDNYTDVQTQARVSSMHIFPPFVSRRNVMFSDKRANAMSRNSYIWVKQNLHVFEEVGGSLNLESCNSRIRGFSVRSKNLLPSNEYLFYIWFNQLSNTTN